MNTVQMQTKETYKANGANYILTTYSKISSYVIDTIINWCVHNEEIKMVFISYLNFELEGWDTETCYIPRNSISIY